jgi:dienelactone hydrolase
MTPTLSRRGFCAAALAPLVPGTARAQDKQPAPLAPLNRFPRAVHEWYVERARAAERLGAARRAKLKTRADAEAYVREVRAACAACFGPLPQKAPLNAKTTGKLERDAYTVEKVTFESRPGFVVTANLYVPKGARGKRPGVVGSCGHSATGKAEPAYQSFAQGLARLGYVALIFDPIGQGERLQYAHLPKGTGPGVGVGEHLLAGNQQFLVGEFFGAWRAWDGIRALDYLLSRAEVDPKHVGITGNSGGGTMTTWLCALDDRWTMAAPSCFVSTFRRNLENELPQDTEQCPPGALAAGLDHSDFLACMAPKPVAVLAQEKDYFDVRGAEDTLARLKPLYKLLGAEDNVALHIGPRGHGFSVENREAMYRWFNRATGVSDAKTEPKLTLEKEEDLWAAPGGRVSELKSRTVWSFTQEKAEVLRVKRALGDAGERPNRNRTWESRLAALKLPERTGAPDYRVLRPVTNRKYPKPHATTYALETEAPAVAVVYRLGAEAHSARPTKSAAPAILYVSHQSADAELRDEPLLAELVKAEPNAVLYACDPRGVGESRPDTCGTNQFLNPYGSDYFYAIHGLMLNRPYAGQKAHDVLCVLDWLAEVGHEQIHLVAKGWGAIPATFAALLHDRVSRVTLKHALTSFAALAESEVYMWPLSCFVPNALGAFDLPECYAALERKKLKQIEPRGARGG